jgi:hypothetical protein
MWPASAAVTPQYRERDPEAQNEHQRQPEGAQHARLAIAVASHEAHHQRNHGQHARVRCREHAAHEHGQDGQRRAAVEVLAGVAGQLGEHYPAFAAAMVSQETISVACGMRPEHFTSVSMTRAGVIITPNFVISSIFSTFSSDASTPD